MRTRTHKKKKKKPIDALFFLSPIPFHSPLPVHFQTTTQTHPVSRYQQQRTQLAANSPPKKTKSRRGHDSKREKKRRPKNKEGFFPSLFFSPFLPLSAQLLSVA
jgi:hypothetical protein